MAKKARYLICTVCFAAFLLAIGAAFIVKEPIAVLISERRKAAQFPEFSFSSVMDKSFFDGVEDYLTDQFPLRDGLRALKSSVETKLFGKKDNNGVFYAEGHISEIYPTINESSVKNAAKKINSIYEKYLAAANTRVFCSVIPDKSCYLAEKNGYPAFDYEEMIKIFTADIKSMQYIDISDCLSLDSYYRTDTHWRQESLGAVAEKLSLKMNFDFNIGDFEAEKLSDFDGVYSTRIVTDVQSDDLICLRNEVTDSAIVCNAETGEKTVGVYNLEKLGGNDKYDVFLSGATPIISAENPLAKEKRELVIFRDSFGSSLAPLMLPGYSKITLVDTRYISSQLLDEYVDFENCDVLFIYNTQLLNQSTMLK